MLIRLPAVAWAGALALTLALAPGLRAQNSPRGALPERSAATERYLYVLRENHLYAYEATSQELVSTAIVPGIASSPAVGAGAATEPSRPIKKKSPTKNLALQGLERSAASGSPNGEYVRKAREKARQKAKQQGETTGAKGASAPSKDPMKPRPDRFGAATQLVANEEKVLVINGAQIHTFEAGTLRSLGSRTLSFENPRTQPHPTSLHRR